MPPRLLQPFPLCTLSSPTSLFSCLLKSSTQQHSYATILGSLSDTKGAYSKKIRRGRGPASGKGKTSGRGHGGQKQHGKVPFGFNGGQSKDEVVSGIRGYDNQFSLPMTTINLDQIQEWIDQGRIDPSQPITMREMHRSRLTHGIKNGVKILARDRKPLTTPIHITASRASAKAIAAIEAVGGTVQTRYYTDASIRRILKGESHPTISLLSRPFLTNPTSLSTIPLLERYTSPEQAIGEQSTEEAIAEREEAGVAAVRAEVRRFRYRLPDPARRKDIEYYRDPAHRGYLSYQIKVGESPSLFFKAPPVGAEALGRKRAVKAAKIAAEDKLW